MQTKSNKSLFPIGIGTWKMGEEAKEFQKEVNAIKYSLSLGQNHIDTAEMYGNGGAEKVVGEAIKGSRREDLYIASKLWKQSVGANQVRPALASMLERLETDYLDMIYIHAPWEGIAWEEGISQINDLMDEGIVRDFGVSNFMIHQIKKVFTLSKYPIKANQIYYNCLYQNDVVRELKEFCDIHEIKIVAYCPLAKGEIMKDPHNISAQEALKWCIDQGALPIPKAVNLDHIKDNINVLD